MDPIASSLRDARAAAARAAEAAARESPPETPVDVEGEFGGRLRDLAGASKAVAEGLSDDGTDPVAVIASLQRLITDTESLIVRYRKVDAGTSQEMRKRAIELLYGQPDGVSQLIRNLTSGVYETGNATCLPAVVDLVTRTCDLQEDMGRLVYGGG